MRTISKISSVLVVLLTVVGACAAIARAQQEPTKMQSPRNPNAGWLGAKFAPVNDEAMDQLKLETQDGVLIVETIENSPAEAAGLKQGDVLRKIDDKDIKDTDDLRSVMSKTSPGQQVKLGVWREGKMQEIPATLAKIPADLMNPPGEKQAPATGPTTKPRD